MPPRTSTGSKPSAPSSRAPRSRAASPARLTEVEREIIGFFAPWGEVLGVPPSVAQIYGLLYASGTPLSPDEIRERLNASKGSVSQGLRFLRDRSLVKLVPLVGDRRERYEAVASPGLFIQTQLRGEVLPRLESGAERLATLKAHIRNDAALATRVARLEGWNHRGRELLPMLLQLLGG